LPSNENRTAVEYNSDRSCDNRLTAVKAKMAFLAVTNLQRSRVVGKQCIVYLLDVS